ncbi:MDR family MFS transporter [Streptomyces blattellae]|uniref:MDR family MFS transporter n=1 Tax=Streptomyces blattellae TaxID=2569855 RepID=UPI0012B8491E|nr:MDR family MFS transporter [Streptomyces blattellae]
MDTQTPPGSPLSRREVRVVLGALLAGMLLSALDQTIVATAVPTIAGDIGGFDNLPWVYTAYLLTSTTTTPLYGKLSDVFGRKVIYQIAIVLFLAGSVLCGLAQDMTQLILFRGLQGVGAGGLTAMAFAILADIVSPRERGRYSGYFGGLLAFASVLGPLLGGFFVDHLSWRWIFLVNVPIGVAALFATTTALRLPFARRPQRLDLAGAALLMGGATTLLLVLEWGGNEYAWASATIVTLGAAALLLLVAFLLWERRAAEPILPLGMFRDSIFTLGVTLSFLAGCTMFGAILFLPLFQQTVTGASATNSGLLLLPLMAGLTGTSIVTGHVVTATGRYKVWPIVGTAVSATGMWLLSRMDPGTSQFETSVNMFVLGLGIGMTMGVLILAVQNSVGRRDLGVASSAINFFRSMGGAVGTAVFGVIFTTRLSHELSDVPASGDPSELAGSPERIQALPDPVEAAVVEGMSRSIGTVFLVLSVALLVGLVLACFLREIPLRDSAHIGRGDAVGVDPPGVVTAGEGQAPKRRGRRWGRREEEPG